MARAGRKKMALGFHPLSTRKKVVIMTDFEMLSIVIMIIMLVISAMSLYKNDK